MRGMNASTGAALSGLAHLRQSVRDILTTPLGTRVMRRDYGSRLFDLSDAPMNRRTMMDIYAATVEAVERWEPRLRVKTVKADVLEPGRLSITLEAEYLPNGAPITIDRVIVGKAPVITSPTEIQFKVGEALSYQITALNSPTTFFLIGQLPAGVSFYQPTGIISGTPSSSSSVVVIAGASNPAGYDEIRLLFDNDPYRESSIAFHNLVHQQLPLRIATWP